MKAAALTFLLLALPALPQRPQIFNVSPTDARAIPSIRELPKKPMVNVTFTGSLQLDGLNCEQCTFRNIILNYSGGAFRCIECWFDSSVTLQLHGAAVNGASMATWMQAVRAHDTSPMAAFGPNTIQVTVVTPFKTDLYSVSAASAAPKR